MASKPQDSQTAKQSQRKPSFSKQIHVPGHPNAFTYALCNGKRKIDKTLQRFCIKHKCVGVFEVKVRLKEFGLRNRDIGRIAYSVTENGIALKFDSERNGFDFFVPFPATISVSVPANPSALYIEKGGLLSCRVPICEHCLDVNAYNAHKQPKLGVLGGKKKRKWKHKLDTKLQSNHEKLSQIQIQKAH